MSVTHLKGNLAGSLCTPPRPQHTHTKPRKKNPSRPADPAVAAKAVRAVFSPSPFYSQVLQVNLPPLAERTRSSELRRSLAPPPVCGFRWVQRVGAWKSQEPGLGSCRRKASKRTPGPSSNSLFYFFFFFAASGDQSPGRSRSRLGHPFQGKEAIPSRRGAGGGRKLTLNHLASAPSEVAAPSPTLVGRGNLPSNLGALALPKCTPTQ